MCPWGKGPTLIYCDSSTGRIGKLVAWRKSKWLPMLPWTFRPWIDNWIWSVLIAPCTYYVLCSNHTAVHCGSLEYGGIRARHPSSSYKAQDVYFFPIISFCDGRDILKRSYYSIWIWSVLIDMALILWHTANVCSELQGLCRGFSAISTGKTL